MRYLSAVPIILLSLVLLGALACESEGGDPQECTPSNGGVEACDGIDNDCDGEVDEGIEPAACTLDGTDGTQSCVDGEWGECTVEEPCEPTNGGVEACDGIDNDCDGEIDEEAPCAVGLACVDGQCVEVDPCEGVTCEADETCVDGLCVGEDEEICDGLDNDGDGETDEDLSRPCATDCGEGTERCVAGEWMDCDAPQPETEICDGVDNDCDGETDEALEQACSTDCGEGTEICDNGEWVDCDALQPEAEDCDGVDNDCDGETDEGLFARDCDNACGPGAEFCVEGSWQGCTAREPAANDGCGDAIDNDCDGETDEGCPPCEIGVTVPCGPAVVTGLCTPGTRLCDATSSWSEICVDAGGAFLIEPGQVSEDEDPCNGIDDDCDGATDEGQSCPTD